MIQGSKKGIIIRLEDFSIKRIPKINNRKIFSMTVLLVAL